MEGNSNAYMFSTVQETSLFHREQTGDNRNIKAKINERVGSIHFFTSRNKFI